MFYVNGLLVDIRQGAQFLFLSQCSTEGPQTPTDLGIRGVQVNFLLVISGAQGIWGRWEWSGRAGGGSDLGLYKETLAA